MAMSNYPLKHYEEETSEDFKKEMDRKIKILGNDCVMLNPGKLIYPRKILSLLIDLYNFEVIKELKLFLKKEYTFPNKTFDVEKL